MVADLKSLYSLFEHGLYFWYSISQSHSWIGNQEKQYIIWLSWLICVDVLIVVLDRCSQVEAAGCSTFFRRRKTRRWPREEGRCSLARLLPNSALLCFLTTWSTNSRLATKWVLCSGPGTAWPSAMIVIFPALTATMCLATMRLAPIICRSVSQTSFVNMISSSWSYQQCLHNDNHQVSNATLLDAAKFECQVGPGRGNPPIRANARLTVTCELDDRDTNLDRWRRL